MRKYRWVERHEEVLHANELHSRRELVYRYDDDGSLVIRAKLPPEIGAVVQKAIEAAMQEAEVAAGEREPGDTRSNAVPDHVADAPEGAIEAQHEGWEPVAERRAARRADALSRLAEGYLDRRAERTGSAADRYQVVVHIDQRLLLAGARFRGNAAVLPCELEGEQALALETARRLGCDCSLVGVVDDPNGEPLSVGRKTRSIPPMLQRARYRLENGALRMAGGADGLRLGRRVLPCGARSRKTEARSGGATFRVRHI